jgi:hypothetical protein
MRVPPLKLLILASGFAVIVEALTWTAASVTARFSSEGLVYRFCAGFHQPAEALRFFLFRDVENHPAFADNLAMLFVFFGAALLQWFLIFLVSLALIDWRRTPGRATRTTEAGPVASPDAFARSALRLLSPRCTL